MTMPVRTARILVAVALLVLPAHRLRAETRPDQNDVRSLEGTRQEEDGAHGKRSSARRPPPPASPSEREVEEPPRDGTQDRVRPEMRGTAKPGR